MEAEMGAPMKEIDRIGEQLRAAIEGGAWHGPALQEIVGELTAEEAAGRPLPDAHSPWEILLHVVTWLETVARRLQGEQVALTEAEDWPPIAERDEAAWDDLRSRLEDAHAELQRLFGRMSDDDLDGGIAGQEYDTYYMLHGVIQHTLYHAGQIAVLGKTIRAPEDGQG